MITSEVLISVMKDRMKSDDRLAATIQAIKDMGHTEDEALDMMIEAWIERMNKNDETKI